MTSPRDTNRRLLLLLWAPLAVIVAGWIVHFARLAEGGEIGTLFSSVLLVPAVVGLMLYVRREKEKQLAVALLAPPPPRSVSSRSATAGPSRTACKWRPLTSQR